MYKKLAIAGTFDRLHRGHRYFISRAFNLGERVVIGLTSDIFVKKKLEVRSKKIEVKIINYKEREKELRDFIKSKGWENKAEIVKIHDVYGPAADDLQLQGIVVTKETLAGGRKVNRKRRRLGLKALKIIKIPLIRAEDNKRISSTRVRLGEIDRMGKVFRNLPVFGSMISQPLRQYLKKPLGKLIANNSGDPLAIDNKLKEFIKKFDPAMMITVGDVATKVANLLNLKQDLSIVDFCINRKKVYKKLKELGFSLSFFRQVVQRKTVVVRNPAGYVTRSMVNAIFHQLKKTIKDGKMRVVRVQGEEDLAGLPAILLAPLGSIVLYGQPVLAESSVGRGEGVVVVEVTEKKKKEILQMVSFS